MIIALLIMCFMAIIYAIKTFWDILIRGKKVWGYDSFYLTTNIMLFCIAIFGLFLILCYW